MPVLTNKAPRLSLKKFNSQTTFVANSTVLAPIIPKIQASKVSEFAPLCVC